MPIWNIPTPEAQPSVTALRWRIARVTNRGETFDFIYGWCPEIAAGRISTYIVKFDPATAAVTTRSGRTYALCGPPGNDADAAYVFETTMGHLLKPEMRADATEEYWRAIESAGGRKGPKRERARK